METPTGCPVTGSVTVFPLPPMPGLPMLSSGPVPGGGVMSTCSCAVAVAVPAAAVSRAAARVATVFFMGEFPSRVLSGAGARFDGYDSGYVTESPNELKGPHKQLCPKISGPPGSWCQLSWIKRTLEMEEVPWFPRGLLVAEDRGFEPLRVLLPARVPGV